MKLYINTIIEGKIKVALIDGKTNPELVVKTNRNEAEKLLVLIEKLLVNNNVSFNKIKKIIVADLGGSFTSLRVGVLSANALAYAYGIPVEGESGAKPIDFSKFQVVKPIYDREPNIGISKKKTLL